MGWEPYMRSWMEEKIKDVFNEEIYDRIIQMFLTHIDNGLKFLQNCKEAITQTSLSRVQTVCKLMESMLITSNEVNLEMDQQKLMAIVDTIFVWCFLWGLAGNISEEDWDLFDGFVRQEFEEFTSTKVFVQPNGLYLA